MGEILRAAFAQHGNQKMALPTMKMIKIVTLIGGICVVGGFSLAIAQQHETTYSYDALGRLKQTDYDVSQSQKYTYDAAGNRQQVIVNSYDAPANELPVSILDVPTVNEDATVTFDPRVNDSDPDGDPLTLTLVGSASNGVSVKVGDQITYTPNANWNGVDSFTYTITDGTDVVSGNVDVTVLPVNDAPNGANDSVTINEDVSSEYGVLSNDTDQENDPLTIIATTNGSNGFVAITNAGTKVLYAPNANYNGSDSFTYTVSDGSATDVATVNVTITPVNDAPVAVEDTFSGINENIWTTLNLRANDTDIDGTNFTIASISGGFGEVEIINSGTEVRYRCLTGCGSDDVFNYTITDGELTDSTSVSIYFGSGAPP